MQKGEIARYELFLLYPQCFPPFWRTFKILLNTLWEKEELLLTSNFSFSHSVFYPSGELSTILIKFGIVVCKLLRFGRILNLSFGKGLSWPQISRSVKLGWFLFQPNGSHGDRIPSSLIADPCFDEGMWESSWWFRRSPGKRKSRKAWIGVLASAIKVK